MKIYEDYLNYLNEADPVGPLIGASAVAGVYMANIVRSSKRRKKCMEVAKTIKNSEKRKDAYVKCYSIGI